MTDEEKRRSRDERSQWSFQARMMDEDQDNGVCGSLTLLCRSIRMMAAEGVVTVTTTSKARSDELPVCDGHCVTAPKIATSP